MGQVRRGYLALLLDVGQDVQGGADRASREPTHSRNKPSPEPSLNQGLNQGLNRTLNRALNRRQAKAGAGSLGP